MLTSYVVPDADPNGPRRGSALESMVMASGHDGTDRRVPRAKWSSRTTIVTLAISAVLIALASAIVSRTIVSGRNARPTATTEAIDDIYPVARRTSFLGLCQDTGTNAPRCGCLLNGLQRSVPLDALGPIEDAIRTKAPLPASAQAVLAACTAKLG